MYFILSARFKKEELTQKGKVDELVKTGQEEIRKSFAADKKKLEDEKALLENDKRDLESRKRKFEEME